MKISHKKGGFTLIELLIVIAIIALLTGIVMTNLTGAKAKARDTKRVSDVGTIQLALELFYDRCKEYPQSLDLSYVCPNISTITLGTYLSSIPKDPTTGNSYTYDWDPGSSGSVPVMYVLVAQLEGYSSVLKDDIDGDNTQTIGYDCGGDNNSQGTDERLYCLVSN